MPRGQSVLFVYIQPRDQEPANNSIRTYIPAHDLFDTGFIAHKDLVSRLDFSIICQHRDEMEKDLKQLKVRSNHMLWLLYN